MELDYSAAELPIRHDLRESQRLLMEHLRSPGTWWSGAERLAIAAEARQAEGCALCRERKEALSPFSVQGEHDSGGGLPAPMVDEIHRVTTDAARLTEAWYRSLLDQGLSAEAYVEALGVAVLVISVDRFHHALGLPLEPLPTPIEGAPTRSRPEDVVEGEAWVPMRESRRVAAEQGFPGPAPFVIRTSTRKTLLPVNGGGVILCSWGPYEARPF